MRFFEKKINQELANLKAAPGCAHPQTDVSMLQGELGINGPKRPGGNKPIVESSKIDQAVPYGHGQGH